MAYNREEYEFYKNQDPKNLTQEELDELYETERLAAKYPSKEDLEWARFIINEKDPYYQKLNKQNGDMEKANKILQQESAAREVMQQKGQDLYVKKVTTTPEEVVKKGDYHYNWRKSYENVKGGELKPTEADAKKLQNYINSNMYDIDDDVNLKQIAYNLHMFNPNTMKWGDFINSEQGEEFKKYLEDVRKAQTDKAVDKIWSGEEPTESYYPGFGTANVPLSNFAVDFTAPVSKEYARNHYNDEDFSLVKTLSSTDLPANIVMTGPYIAERGLAKLGVPVVKAFKKPLAQFLYGNLLAPAITETGNMAFNNESIPDALIRTGEATAMNVGTPRILQSILSSVGRGLPKGDNRTVQKMIDNAVNKAEKVASDMKKGKPYPIKSGKQNGPLEFQVYSGSGKKNNALYSTDPEQSNKNWNVTGFKSVEDMPAETITEEELNAFNEGIPFSRSRSKKEGYEDLAKAQDSGVKFVENIRNNLILKKAEALSKDGDLRSLSPSELRQLGFANKESFTNWLIRSFKDNMPETLKAYLTNAAGRPEFGRTVGPIEYVNHILGTSFLHKKDSEEEKQKSRIERLLGM